MGKWSRVDLLERPSALDRGVTGRVSRAITADGRQSIFDRDHPPLIAVADR
jgi:hypothetical protein